MFFIQELIYVSQIVLTQKIISCKLSRLAFVVGVNERSIVWRDIIEKSESIHLVLDEYNLYYIL
jgi:hypothetical protein